MKPSEHSPRVPEHNQSASYFLLLGGYCLNSFCTALSILLVFLSALSERVPEAAPRQTSFFCSASERSTTRVPTLSMTGSMRPMPPPQRHPPPPVAIADVSFLTPAL